MSFLISPAILLALLTLPWAVVRTAAGRGPQAEPAGRLGIALLFAFTGAGHFARTDGLEAMLPGWVPARQELVLATGVLEIALGLAVLVPAWRRPAGGLLAAMLVAFLPVNVWAAWNRVPFGGHELGPVYLLLRVPLQLAFLAWVVHFTGLRPFRGDARRRVPHG